MPPLSFQMLLRALAMCLSFFGLCATARDSLKLNRFVAPFFCACCIIATLMFAGMLRVLGAGFLLLYLGGFAGLIYTYIVRRTPPDFVLIGIFFAFVACLAWRFYPCPLYRNDDISHWGLVARYLLDHDAFPDGSASIVFFQSYPLGSASFIYYVCRTVCNWEGMWVIAQSLLMGLFFLPLLAHIQKNRAYLIPVALGLFVYLFKSNRGVVNLQVDWLLGFFGLGAAAALTAHRNDLKRAVWIAVPAILAVVYIKNSGMFFALLTLLILARIARSQGCSKRTIAALLILGTLGFAAAYGLWTLHVRLSYPAGLSTKHAISLQTYARQASAKGPAFILKIAVNMLLEWVHPHFYQCFAALFMAGSFCLVALTGRTHPELRAEARAVRRRLAGCIAVYAVWYAMIFGMYIFSMPEGEALVLASYFRYNATGLICMIGLATIVLFDFFSLQPLHPHPAFRAVFAGAMACYAAVILLTSSSGFFSELFVRESEYIPLRERLIQAKERYQLPEGGRYMIFAVDGAEDRSVYNASFVVKYDLKTADQLIIASPLGEAVYGCGTLQGERAIADPLDYIRKHLDSCDALLVLDAHVEFEALLDDFLQDYDGETPVIFLRRTTDLPETAQALSLDG